MVERDLYRLLGVPPTASPERIRSAYRKLVRRYHPDVYGGDPEVSKVNFRAITEAYETLRDPARRKDYDIERSEEWRDLDTRGGGRDRSGIPRAVTIPRTAPARWVHYPAPEPPWTRPPAEYDPVALRILRAWRAANGQSLRAGGVPRHVKVIVFLLFVSFLSIMTALLTVPVNQAFTFADSASCYGQSPTGQSTSTSYQFLAGDLVAFSWVTAAGSTGGVLGGPPPGVALVSAYTGTVYASAEWNGTFSFVADGGSYSFATLDCSTEPAIHVQFNGNYQGPLL